MGQLHDLQSAVVLYRVDASRRWVLLPDWRVRLQRHQQPIMRGLRLLTRLERMATLPTSRPPTIHPLRLQKTLRL